MKLILLKVVSIGFDCHMRRSRIRIILHTHRHTQHLHWFKWQARPSRASGRSWGRRVGTKYCMSVNSVLKSGYDRGRHGPWASQQGMNVKIMAMVVWPHHLLLHRAEPQCQTFKKGDIEDIIISASKFLQKGFGMIFKTPIILRDLKDPFITDHILPGPTTSSSYL